MDERYYEETMYTCKFCNEVYDSTKGIEEHLEECLLNFVDKSTCVTCKHACLVLESPLGKDSGYKRLSLLKVLSSKNWLECDKGVYEGKIREDNLMREEKSCFEPITEEADKFIIKKTDKYKHYKKLIDESIIEQEEIDKEIEEFHLLAKELTEQGLSEEEIQEILNEKYKEE